MHSVIFAAAPFDGVRMWISHYVAFYSITKNKNLKTSLIAPKDFVFTKTDMNFLIKSATLYKNGKLVGRYLTE